MCIFDKFKDTLADFVNSLDNGFDIKVLAELRQIYILSNDIFGLEKR